MSFRRDKLEKKRRQRTLILLGVAVVLGALLLVFGARPLVSTGYRVSVPFWQVKRQLGDRVNNVADLALLSKKELLARLQELEDERKAERIDLIRADILERENEELREALGHVWPEESWLVAGILVKPPQTPYDVLVLDVGSEDGVLHDQLVFTNSGVVVGLVKEVLPRQSFVTLLSTPGIQTDVVIESQGVAVTARGRGGGTYQVYVPRDLEIAIGDQVVLPGRQTEVLGQIGEILFDPRDPFQTAFVSAPANFYHQRFVYVSDRTIADIPEVETVVLEVAEDEEVDEEI